MEMDIRRSESRIFLANVGANASHGFAGPVFADGRFEFLPIPEVPDINGPFVVRYGDLRSFNGPSLPIDRYFPDRMKNRATHNDPEFETLTYGDNCDVNSRAAGLKLANPGDHLFFLVRLAYWIDDRPTGRHGFFLIGVLHIDGILKRVMDRPTGTIIRAFRNNAHVRRGLTHPELWDGFWIFRGGDGSRRFQHAVPVDRALCERIFRKADGSAWEWSKSRTDLQVIGSYTRTCRCVIDTSNDDGAERARILWEHVRHYENRGKN